MYLNNEGSYTSYACFHALYKLISDYLMVTYAAAGVFKERREGIKSDMFITLTAQI